MFDAVEPNPGGSVRRRSVAAAVGSKMSFLEYTDELAGKDPEP